MGHLRLHVIPIDFGQDDDILINCGLAYFEGCLVFFDICDNIGGQANQKAWGRREIRTRGYYFLPSPSLLRLTWIVVVAIIRFTNSKVILSLHLDIMDHL